MSKAQDKGYLGRVVQIHFWPVSKSLYCQLMMVQVDIECPNDPKKLGRLGQTLVSGDDVMSRVF